MPEIKVLSHSTCITAHKTAMLAALDALRSIALCHWNIPCIEALFFCYW